MRPWEGRLGAPRSGGAPLRGGERVVILPASKKRSFSRAKLRAAARGPRANPFAGNDFRATRPEPGRNFASKTRGGVAKPRACRRRRGCGRHSRRHIHRPSRRHGPLCRGGRRFAASTLRSTRRAGPFSTRKRGLCRTCWAGSRGDDSSGNWQFYPMFFRSETGVRGNQGLGRISPILDTLYVATATSLKRLRGRLAAR